MALPETLAEGKLVEFKELQLWRSTFESHWEEVARVVMPAQRNTFTWENRNIPGEKKTQEQLDSTPALALSRFGAIVDSLLTPRNSTWHTLQADNDDLMKVREVKLFKYRYAPTANFSGQNQQSFKSLGAFGTGPLFVDEYQGMRGERGLRYRALPLGECYFRENHQGIIDTLFRAFELTVRQFVQWFPDHKSDKVQAKVDAKKWDEKVRVLHVVEPRNDFDPERFDARGKLFRSLYISFDDKIVVREGGYNSFPAPTARYDVAANEIYGRGPAMQVLPAIKTLNEQKRVLLQQGHRALAPVLIGHDDGAAAFNMRPGAFNSGHVNKDGRPLVHAIPPGRIDVGHDMMDDERAVINDAFLVSLFQILTESPQMTATEVIERVNEKGILLSPTIGQQQSEYLGPMIERELDLLASMKLLDPIPPALAEAQGEYKVIYTSPLSKSQRAQETAGLWRTIEQVITVAQATGDPRPMDHFNWDEIIPDVADNSSLPVRWLNGQKQIIAIREQRAKAQQAQMQIQAAPAEAAMMKAEAAAAKTR